MRYSVPFISQKIDLPPDWHSRGCGIVSLKMLLEYWHSVDPSNKTISIDELLKEGLLKNAYIEKVGWSHGGLVSLAKDLGYHAFNRDLAPQSKTPLSKESAFEELLKDLALGPVMASVWTRFDPGAGGGHMVVVEGWDEKNVFVADPEQTDVISGKITISKEDFLRAWKQRTICIHGK